MKNQYWGRRASDSKIVAMSDEEAQEVISRPADPKNGGEDWLLVFDVPEAYRKNAKYEIERKMIKPVWDWGLGKQKGGLATVESIHKPTTKQLIEKALNENRFLSDSVEEFVRYVGGCVTCTVEGTVVNSPNTQNVAVVHDSSGYNPEACVYVSWYGSEDEAAQEAYEALETYYREHYADHIKEVEQDAVNGYIEDHAEELEAGKTKEDLTQDAYDQGIPESWWKESFDGMVFNIPGNEILRVLKADTFASEHMEDLSIEEPEVEEPEEEE